MEEQLCRIDSLLKQSKSYLDSLDSDEKSRYTDALERYSAPELVREIFLVVYRHDAEIKILDREIRNLKSDLVNALILINKLQIEL